MMGSAFIKKAAMAAALLVLAWVCGFLIFLIAVSVITPDEDAPQVDAIIVLTGGQNRVNTGLDLLRDGYAGYLFVSGVNEQVAIQDLVRMWDPEADFIPCCIFLGRAALDTEGNARESSAWVRREGLDSIRLVTSNYHTPRAWLEFSHALPRRHIVLHPIRPASMDEDSRHFLRLSFGEYNKTLLTWVRLYVYPWDRIVTRPPKS